LFTEHSLHVNSLGKEISAKPLTISLLATILRKAPDPICLHWKK